MPGHYVQMEVANDVQPPVRRLLRSVFGNGPYIEGWAQFATRTMIEQGFLDHSPELALTFAKEELRVLANTILDVRLHMLDMSDQEALDLMEQRTFQEHEEAVEKLQRAKLSSCQAGTKSRWPRSTASRYATIFRATASVARLALPFCFSVS